MFTWTSLKSLGLWFVVGGFRCVFFIYCVARFVACDLPVSGYNRLACLEDFSVLSYSCHLQECLPPSLDKNSTHHRDFLRRSQFCFCEPSWASVFKHCGFALTPPPLKWERPKIPPTFAKRAARYNEFGSKAMAMDSVSFLSLGNSLEFFQYLF